MTTYRMGDADVRLFVAATDSDLAMYLGAYAELSTDAGTALYSKVGDEWTRDSRTTADQRRDDFTLVFETDRPEIDDVDPSAVPLLEHRLQQLALARRVATKAHAGQTDKLGDPYIEHPRRVAARLDGLEEQAVAWLHDVVEDTAVTEEDLRAVGIDGTVVDAVLLLSRNHGDSGDYHGRIGASPLARAVKLADIADNLDPARTARLDDDTRRRLAMKYRDARRALGAEEEQA